MKQKVLFIYPKLGSFIKSDIEILKLKYDVVEFNFRVQHKILLPMYLLKLFFTILLGYKKYSFVISSFGGYHSFFPSLFSKFSNLKSFIIVHGTDCTSIPALGYGNFRKPILSWFLRFSYRNTTKIFPVSESLVYSKNEYDHTVGKQGIKSFVENLTTPIEVIHNGSKIENWNVAKSPKKDPNSFITVVSGNSQFELKGLDLFIRMAKQLPYFNFTIVGLDTKFINISSSSNLKIYPFLNQEELKKLYSLNQFYMQLSISEGFGMSLCEAMLCELIPIGSNVNMIPEIIGDTGFIVRKKNSDDLKKTILKAVEITNKLNLGKIARQKIIDNYSFDLRKEKLLNALSQIK